MYQMSNTAIFNILNKAIYLRQFAALFSTKVLHIFMSVKYFSIKKSLFKGIVSGCQFYFVSTHGQKLVLKESCF